MTTPVSNKKLLKEFLDGLDEKTLKDLQWHLVLIEINGSHPIPKSKLPENASVLITVDKLVEGFGEDGAVERTVETLREMNCYGLASKLEEAKKDQSLEQKEDEPETSSARETPREVDPNIPEEFLRRFKNPVVMPCGHTFCGSCIYKDWETLLSVCEHVFPEVDNAINFNLKSLCENYGRSQGEPSGGHRNNTETFQFQTPPKSIREKQEALKVVEQWRDSSLEHTETWHLNRGNEIMDDIKRRHALLDEEEKTRRAALREEARRKTRVIHWIADTAKDKFIAELIEENERFKANVKLYKFLMLSVLLAAGIGCTYGTFPATDTFANASGKPSTRSLGDVKQLGKEWR